MGCIFSKFFNNNHAIQRFTAILKGICFPSGLQRWLIICIAVWRQDKMETQYDVEDVQETRLTKKHVRTLDTWRIHYEEWRGDCPIYITDQCTVLMSRIQNMLNYSPEVHYKDRWLNNELIVAYASIFENDWCRVIGATHFMSFARTGQLPKGWQTKCTNLV